MLRAFFDFIKNVDSVRCIIRASYLNPVELEGDQNRGFRISCNTAGFTFYFSL